MKKNGGITLIALVITIIVLLILAGVTIATITGENGIITKAKEAKENTETAQANEEGVVNILDALSSGLIDENGFFQESSTIDRGNPSATNPTIPEGFRAVNTEISKWGNGKNPPAEDDVNAGLVIEDKDGNQFVWVPVDGAKLKYEKHTYATPSVDDTAAVTTDTGNGNWKTYQYRNYSDWTDNGGNADSVGAYGGFYIARYEAGVPENADFYASKDGDSYATNLKNTTQYIPVSKAGKQVWNCISQVNALAVAESMYAKSTSVTSQLIDGYAWDTVTTWLSNSKYNVANSIAWGNYYDASFTIDGLYATHVWANNNAWTVATQYNYGKHTINSGDRTETATGITERNKANNIYDFAGNMHEWTTETGKCGGTSTTYAVLRGSSFGNSGDSNPASYRAGNSSASSAYINFGFRVVLYIK